MTNTYNKQIIVVLAFILIVVFMFNYSPVESYLRKMKYDDEFSNIEFVEDGEYKRRVDPLLGGSETILKNLGTYTRYKVYAKKADIYFFVQYRSDLKNFEDDYMLTKYQKDILKEISDIWDNNFENDVSFRYGTTIANDEVGVLEKRVPELISDVDIPIDEICSKEFAVKFKKLRDDIHNYLMSDYFNKERSICEYFNLKLFGSNYSLQINNYFGAKTDITLKLKGKENREYKEKFENNNQYDDCDANAYIVKELY